MKEKIKVLNLANFVIICIIFILEMMPNSVKIEFENKSINYMPYLMDPNALLWGIPFPPFIVALFTIALVVIDAVVLFDERIRLKITALVFNSISLIGSLIYICLCAITKDITLQNIIIPILSFAKEILYCVTLRMAAEKKKTVKE